MTINTVCIATKAGMTEEGRMLQAAQRRHGHIEPCGGKTWAECFTKAAGMNMLWYNDVSGSTHIICSKDIMPEWQAARLRKYIKGDL